jgi:hypothetical protein
MKSAQRQGIARTYRQLSTLKLTPDWLRLALPTGSQARVRQQGIHQPDAAELIDERHVPFGGL